MKLSKEQIDWLRHELKEGDYFLLNTWGEDAFDIQNNLETALDDLAEAKQENENLRLAGRGLIAIIDALGGGPKSIQPDLRKLRDALQSAEEQT